MSFVCDNCGHSMLEDSDLSGEKRPLKVRGWAIMDKGEIFQLCSICVQVQLTINKDSLYKMGYRKLFFGNMDSTMETCKYGYEVLTEEPWIKQIRPER